MYAIVTGAENAGIKRTRNRFDGAYDSINFIDSKLSSTCQRCHPSIKSGTGLQQFNFGRRVPLSRNSLFAFY